MHLLMRFLLICIFAVKPLAGASAIHLPIYRRGGRFARHELANITSLSRIVGHVEERYARTYTDVDGNRIVRRWRNEPIYADRHMLDEAGLEGLWYTKLQVGEPPQTLEVDLDMLSPDFYTIMTTSEQGSKYDTFGSSTHEGSNYFPHAGCRIPSDMFHLPYFTSGMNSIRLNFPICQAPKCSRHTLAASGSILGLSPSGARSLSRLTSSSFIQQLLDQQKIQHNLFSLAILDSASGVLSLGGSIAAEMEATKIRQEIDLKYLGQPDSQAKEEEIGGALNFAIPSDSTHEDHFKWTDVGNGAAAGWHMTLVTGVWVGGVKVLKNQPVLLDINCPVILAPPVAAERLYESISGTKRLTTLLNESHPAWAEARRFWTAPCLNAVDISFEIAGWRYPVMSGEGLREDDIHGPAGGRFSLGKVDLRTSQTGTEDWETGYCVGLLIETAMGLREEWQRSDMRDVWVLGEPFFRGLGVTFDLGDEKGKGGGIGFRSY